MYSQTTATKKIARLDKRIRAIAGGTSASKTISILLYLIAKAQSDKKPTLTSVVSESFPHLRKGAMRDFLDILKTHGYYDDNRWSKTSFIYEFETGSKIEFFSADQPGKVRGPRRDRLFVNECNNVSKESWEQLLIRTREFAFADWNPVQEFFMYQDYIEQRDDVDFIILTYKDNEALGQSIVGEIEKRKGNKNWWKVYGLGQLGEAEGKIYTDWKIIDEIPHNARLERRGLDFGYAHDPAAIVDVYKYDGGYILDEQIYQIGLHNRQLAEAIKNMEKPHTLVVADSAEPKSIDEIKMYGVPIMPAKKGQGSLSQSIQFLQDQRVSMTKRSTNLIKEYRNYLWKTDNDGKVLPAPEPGMDHILDAARYAISSMHAKKHVKPYKPTNMVQRKYGRA